MSNDTHDDCWKLLPWFVTGRLSAPDVRRIERHLEDCAACRAEIEEQRALYMHIRRDESVMLAPQASLQKLMARIDGNVPVDPSVDPPVDAVASHPKTTEKSTRGQQRYRWLAIAAAVQTMAIAFLLALVWRQTADVMTAPRFTTLSNPQVTTSSGATLRIVFKPETPAGQMQSLLRSVNAQIIAGPTEAGVYTVRLERDADLDRIAQALSQVRADGHVVFAEHVSVERKP